jgi:hypothetical protein
MKACVVIGWGRVFFSQVDVEEWPSLLDREMVHPTSKLDEHILRPQRYLKQASRLPSDH